MYTLKRKEKPRNFHWIFTLYKHFAL